MSARQWVLEFFHNLDDSNIVVKKSAIVVSAETALHARNRILAAIRKSQNLRELNLDVAERKGPFRAEEYADDNDELVPAVYETMLEMVKGAWIEEVKEPLIVDL